MRQDSALEALNKAAFDSFDDYEGDGYDDYDPDNLDDSYDPDNYDEYDEFGKKKGNRMGGQQRGVKPSSGIRQSPARRRTGAAVPEAQFDISVVSTMAANTNIELFNAQNTISEFANQTTNNGFHPLLAARSFTDAAADPFFGYGINTTLQANATIVYFDETGNLVYEDRIAATKVTISCKQIPYRSLMKYAERGSFKVNKMRMKFTTSGQINNDIVHQTKTFLGATKTNQISVSSYFRPDQFQSLLVDVPISYRIDAEKGLLYTINANETVLINMFVSEYSRSAL